MKKTAVMILTAAALAAVSAPLTAFAAEPVNVTFSLETLDQNSDAYLTVQGNLTVTDTDNDGKLTPADVLYLAHEKYYPGGAAAGMDNEYIWGVGACYTCNIDDRNGNCVYTSSGPYHTRYTVEDGDSLSWTAQYLMENDYYGISIKEIPDPVKNEVLVGSILTVHIEITPKLKKNVGKVSAEGLKICVDGLDTNVRTDKNGDGQIIIGAPGYHRIQVFRPGSDEELCWHEVITHEDAPYELTAVKIYTANNDKGVVVDTALDIYDMDKDGKLTAYDAIYNALQRDRLCGESEFADGIVCGRTGEFVVQVNQNAAVPLSRANQLPVTRNDQVIVRPASQLDELYTVSWTTDFGGLNSMMSFFQDDTQELIVRHYAADSAEPTAVPYAELLIDGKATGMMTDQNGKATISLRGVGKHTVTANIKNPGKAKNYALNYAVFGEEAVASTTTATTAVQNTTTTTAAVLTTTAQLAASNAKSSAAASANTAAAKTGSVQAGDSVPLAALLLAGMTAAEIAVVSRKKQSAE